MNKEQRRRASAASRASSAAVAHTPTANAPRPPSAGLARKLRYRFDLALARGPLVVVGYLAVIMIVIILVAATLITLFSLSGLNGDPQGISFGEAFWQSLIRVVDSGGGDGDQHWPTRVISLLVTLSGIFLAGSLIGLIATALDQQISNLRKGRSEVLERGHTLVLGWSPRLPVILSELVIANANQRKQALVVLAGKAKDEMEDELRRAVPDTQTTRVVCRTGDPGSAADLHLANVTGARSVIVLAGDEGDAGVVKTVLAVRSIDPEFAGIRLVAELESKQNADTLRALTDHRIATVQADEVISQVTAQACHQGGLAGVFRDLLDFDGDEIYFSAVPELVGHTYREALTAFDGCSVMGVFSGGEVLLNPAMDRVFGADDEVIAVAADDDRIIFTGFRDDLADHALPGTPFTEPAQRIAIIGWSTLGLAVMNELDQFLGDGSVVDLLVDRTMFLADQVVLPEGLGCTVNVHRVPSGAEALLDVVTEHRYDQAIVLGYRHGLTAAQADARTMLTLLALTRAWEGNAHRPRVVAEMLDRANVEIAQSTGVDDFIVSDELSSLMIAQVSERLELQDVFRELFDAVGCFVALHPAPLYAGAEQTDFATVVAAAAARGESAMGYRVGNGAAVLNPPKSTVLTLAATDQVLVLGPRQDRPAAAPALESIPAGTAPTG